MGSWRIFDVGCGSGLIAKVFHDLCVSDDNKNEENTSSQEMNRFDINNLNVPTYNKPEQSIMVGIDVSPKMVQIAESTTMYHLLLVGDLYEALQFY